MAQNECQDCVNGVIELRKWVKTQAHLPNEYIQDIYLKMSYHSCGHNIESTREVLDLNLTLRTMFAFFQNRTLSSLDRALQSWLVSPLPGLTNKGYLPIYCQLLNPDLDKFVYVDVVRAFFMVIDFCLHEESNVEGISLILNLEKVSAGHLSRVDLIVAQQTFYFLQEASIVRLKEFHFMNAPSFMDRVLSMFKPFMKDELLETVYVHQIGSPSLNEFLSLEALPRDIGGQCLGSKELRDEIRSKIEANEKFFIDDARKVVNESLRSGGPKTMGEVFPNVESSFKQLQID